MFATDIPQLPGEGHGGAAVAAVLCKVARGQAHPTPSTRTQNWPPLPATSVLSRSPSSAPQSDRLADHDRAATRRRGSQHRNRRRGCGYDARPRAGAVRAARFTPPLVARILHEDLLERFLGVIQSVLREAVRAETARACVRRLPCASQRTPFKTSFRERPGRVPYCTLRTVPRDVGLYVPDRRPVTQIQSRDVWISQILGIHRIEFHEGQADGDRSMRRPRGQPADLRAITSRGATLAALKCISVLAWNSKRAKYASSPRGRPKLLG